MDVLLCLKKLSLRGTVRSLLARELVADLVEVRAELVELLVGLLEVGLKEELLHARAGLVVRIGGHPERQLRSRGRKDIRWWCVLHAGLPCLLVHLLDAPPTRPVAKPTAEVTHHTGSDESQSQVAEGANAHQEPQP